MFYHSAFSAKPPGRSKTMKSILLLNLLIILAVTTLVGCAVQPQPFTPAELQEQAKADLKVIFKNQEPLKNKVTLYDAMARAIKYNLDHKVKLLENAMAKGALVQSQKDLLPQLVTSAGYTNRNNYNTSYSENLTTHTTTTASDLSISEEKNNFSADLIFVWNILDFGVGYNQAKQQANQVLIAEEQRRKTAQNIAQEVRYSFWRTVSAEKLLPKMDLLLKQVEFALERSRQMEKAHADKPIKVLDYQQELLETVQQLWDMRRSLALAKTELSTLMNLKPGAQFSLEIPRKNKLNYPEFSLELLEKFALLQRPELRTEAYNERIGALEVKKAMLRMLPGLEFSTGANFDNNDFLYNNNWISAGLNLSWNAFSLLSGPTAKKNASMQKDLARQRHMASSMMILSQVNLAKQQYHLSIKEYQIISQLDEVHRRKLWHTDAAKKTKTGTELEEIRSKLNALSAEMQLGLAFAGLQGSIGNIYNSIGFDPLPSKIKAKDLPTLASVMENHDNKLITHFSKKNGSIFSIQNPFHIRQILDLKRNFVNNKTGASENSAKGSDSKNPPTQLPVSADTYAALPGAAYVERRVFKKKKKTIPQNAPEDTSQPSQDINDEQILISLKQDQALNNSFYKPGILIGFEDEELGPVPNFPSSNRVKKLLADLRKSKSKQLNKLAEQLSTQTSSSTYKPVVTLNGTPLTVSGSSQGTVLAGTSNANNANSTYPASNMQPFDITSNKKNPTYIMHKNVIVGPK